MQANLQRTDTMTAASTAESIRQAKSDFLSNISHEIRTPMSAIVGLTNVLLMTKLDSRQRQCLTLMQSSADGLMQMIDNLLNIGRIESGIAAPRLEPFNMAELLAQITGILSIKAEEKGIRLDLHYETGSPTEFIGDSCSIRQIVMNLVSNAIKFTESGGVTLSFDTNGKINGMEQISISVTDTGIGISPNKIGVIFDRFVQADPSIIRKYGGTGLGLAISKALADDMHGSIAVTSVVGKGSAFVLELRLAERAGGGEKGRPPNIIYLDAAAKNHSLNVESPV
jgi:signal transduction histidine kinase